MRSEAQVGMDAKLLYAAPSHLASIVSGHMTVYSMRRDSLADLASTESSLI
jgi:hypothetical protein